MYQLVIKGLTGELPEPPALHAAVERAIAEGEELAARNERLAATYQDGVRRSR